MNQILPTQSHGSFTHSSANWAKGESFSWHFILPMHQQVQPGHLWICIGHQSQHIMYFMIGQMRHFPNHKLYQSTNTQIGQIPFKCFSKPFCVIKRNPWKRGKLEVPTFIIFWGLLQIGSASSLPLWWFIITLRVDGLVGRCLHSHGHKPDQTAGVVYCSYSLILGNW